MPFGDIFHGPFDVTVTHLDSPRPQRLLIENSDSSDGVYTAELGLRLWIEGDEWRLELQYQAAHVAGDPTSGRWHPSFTRNDPSYTVEDGLSFLIRGINGQPIAPILWNRIWVTVAPTDPELNPMHPPATPPDFGIPETG